MTNRSKVFLAIDDPMRRFRSDQGAAPGIPAGRDGRSAPRRVSFTAAGRLRPLHQFSSGKEADTMTKRVTGTPGFDQ